MSFDFNKRVPVNRIIPFSAVDGPGNRTAVFLQGCNINCRYCHNPETRALCVHCGACVRTCPAGALSMEQGRVVFRPEKCVECDTCIHTCTHDASPRIRWMTVEEVTGAIQKQMPFISGVTVSGGECTLYPEFLEALFKAVKKLGLDTLIDSNGMVDFRLYPGLTEAADGVMLDIKAFDPKDHQTVTGYTNETVLKNAVYLAGIGKLPEIRTVVVRELFDPEQVIVNMAKLLSPVMDISQIRYKLIAFRPNGVREQFKIYESPETAYMQKLKELAEYTGFRKIIII